MGIIFKKVSERVFELLKGNGYKLSMYDEFGTRVYDPETARMFFADPVKLMVNIIDDDDDSTIRVNLSKDLNVETVKNLINQLRLTATHYGLLFTVRKYAQTLKPKDFAFLATKPVEESFGLKTLNQLVEKQAVQKDIAQYARFLFKIDRFLREGTTFNDNAYLFQAERLVEGVAGPTDEVLKTIFEEMHKKSHLNWISDAKNKLEGLLAVAKNKLTEGNMDHDDRQVDAMQRAADYADNFEPDRFVDDFLNDYVGYMSVDDIPSDEVEYLMNGLNKDFPTEDKLEDYLANWMDHDSDGNAPSVGTLIDDVVSELKNRGFVLDFMKKTTEAIEEFESWMESFDPDNIFKAQRIKELTQAKALKAKIAEMKQKVVEAKSNKKLIEKQIFNETKNKIFDLAHTVSALKDDPIGLKQKIEPLSESQLAELQKVISDIWNAKTASKINEAIDDVIEIKTITRQHLLETRKNEKSIHLDEKDDLQSVRILAGLEKLNEAWEVSTLEPEVVQSMAAASMPADHHKIRLLNDIKRLVAQLGLPEDETSVDDSGSAFIYVTWNSPDTRCKAEPALSAMGHQVNNDYWLGSSTSEIPLGVFQGLDADANVAEFTEAVEDNVEPKIEICLQQPSNSDDYSNTMEITDEAHDIANELGIDCELYYPTLANGLLFKCINDYDADTLIGALKDAGIDAYKNIDETSDPMYADDDLLDAEFDDDYYFDDYGDEDEDDDLSLDDFDVDECDMAESDLGKPGKNFSKIAKSAAKRYGSKEAGERVAGAVLGKLRKAHPRKYSESEDNIRNAVASHMTPDKDDPIVARNAKAAYAYERMPDAYREGKIAHSTSKAIFDNPYEKDSDEWWAWRTGFKDAKERYSAVDEAKYVPGVTVLTRSLVFDDDHDWEIVKNIKWPYGIQVHYNPNTRVVTWKTAKMKTVANILEKNIDFDATTARDCLDLPIELMDNDVVNEISDQTLQSYIDKAKPQAAGYSGTFGGPKGLKRSIGVTRAMDKIEDNQVIENPKVHDMTGYSDGEVYDISQTDDNINDGDVFKMDNGRAALLYKAWPTMVVGDSNALHSLKDGGKWPKRYINSVKLAKEVAGVVDEATWLGTHMTADAKARDTEESDREYIEQQKLKRKWKAQNPGKAWPGYSKAKEDLENLNEDWGSSDWSALFNFMKRDMDHGMSLEDAAHSAAEFYYDHMGYEHPNDAFDRIMHMWEIRHGSKSSDKQIVDEAKYKFIRFDNYEKTDAILADPAVRVEYKDIDGNEVTAFIKSAVSADDDVWSSNYDWRKAANAVMFGSEEKGATCVGLWYHDEGFGTMCMDFQGDEYDYAREDPYCPY